MISAAMIRIGETLETYPGIVEDALVISKRRSIQLLWIEEIKPRLQKMGGGDREAAQGIAAQPAQGTQGHRDRRYRQGASREDRAGAKAFGRGDFVERWTSSRERRSTGRCAPSTRAPPISNASPTR
jgi:hypothetical protein